MINIGMRMWFFKYDEEGLRFAKCTGGDDGTEDWELFMKLLSRKNDSGGGEKFITESPFVLEQDPAKKKPPVVVGGFSIKGLSSSWKFMEQWLSDVAMQCQDNTPCFIFTRTTIDNPYLNAFTTTSCMDHVFGTGCFREGYSYLYRDGGTMTVSLKINENPLVSKIRRKWVKWTSQINVTEHSPRFLLVERDRKYGLYTLGIPSRTMAKIQRAGFLWNRNHQLWFGAEENIDIDSILDMIRTDALPDPDVLGYVPEWHCHTGQNRVGDSGYRMIKGLLSLLFGKE